MIGVAFLSKTKEPVNLSDLIILEMLFAQKDIYIYRSCNNNKVGTSF